jgi:hypothetical protein
MMMEKCWDVIEDINLIKLLYFDNETKGNIAFGV